MEYDCEVEWKWNMTVEWNESGIWLWNGMKVEYDCGMEWNYKMEWICRLWAAKMEYECIFVLLPIA